MNNSIGNFFVVADAGTWIVDRKTGLIVESPAHVKDSQCIPLMFDIDRWRKEHWTRGHWNYPMELGAKIGILTIGLYYKDKDGTLLYDEPAI